MLGGRAGRGIPPTDQIRSVGMDRAWPTGLVLAGLAAAFAFPALRLSVTPGLILGVLVPGLVFEAAFALDRRDLRAVAGPLAALAVPGVLISAGVVTVVLAAVVGLPVELAFVLGAITAATDPVAVVATLARLEVPPRLRTLVEGESLLNDGTGLILFVLALEAAAGSLGIAEGILRFAVILTASVAIGAVAGFLADRATAVAGHAALHLAISLVLAYGAYQAADRLGLSGIVATVVGAVILGSRMRDRGDAAAAVQQLDRLWSAVALLLTSITLLGIGFAIDVTALGTAAGAIAAGTAAVLVARALMVYVPLAIRRAAGHAEIPPGWDHVLFWSGLRGAIALAAALSLPETIPQRLLLQQIAFGIVLVTLLIQGGTAPFVISRALRSRSPAPHPRSRHTATGAR